MATLPTACISARRYNEIAESFIPAPRMTIVDFAVCGGLKSEEFLAADPNWEALALLR
jgi:hypothetical protein